MIHHQQVDSPVHRRGDDAMPCIIVINRTGEPQCPTQRTTLHLGALNVDHLNGVRAQRHHSFTGIKTFVSLEHR
jgi:hypothetical protein